jgi:hypothetical protein
MPQWMHFAHYVKHRHLPHRTWVPFAELPKGLDTQVRWSDPSHRGVPPYDPLSYQAELAELLAANG